MFHFLCYPCLLTTLTLNLRIFGPMLCHDSVKKMHMDICLLLRISGKGVVLKNIKLNFKLENIHLLRHCADL